MMQSESERTPQEQALSELLNGGLVESPSSYENEDAWLNGKYGPNYAQHGGTYMIKWERYEWSEQLQLYELDLKGRRTAAKHWYETMQ